MNKNTKHCYQFSYGAPNNHGVIYPHGGRDGLAFCAVSHALFKLGYALGGWLFNFGLRDRPPELLPVDLKFLNPNDVIVLTTRPPMDDRGGDDRRCIHRSYTELEEIIFRVLTRFLTWCSRSRVVLAPEIRAKLPPERRDCGTLVFRQNGPVAACTAYHHKRGDRWVKLNPSVKRTFAYLLFLEHLPRFAGLPPLPCGLLVAFGMGGRETLVWSHRLGRDFAWLLEGGSRFTMVEMEATDVPEVPPDLSFADRWDIEVVLDVPIDPQPHGGGRRARPQDGGVGSAPASPA